LIASSWGREGLDAGHDPARGPLRGRSGYQRRSRVLMMTILGSSDRAIQIARPSGSRRPAQPRSPVQNLRVPAGESTTGFWPRCCSPTSWTRRVGPRRWVIVTGVPCLMRTTQRSPSQGRARRVAPLRRRLYLERWRSVPLGDVRVVEGAFFEDSPGALGGAGVLSFGHHDAAVAVLGHRRRLLWQLGGSGVSAPRAG
jgi:hypothetical protein